MRLSAFFLAVIFITLNFVPCKDSRLLESSDAAHSALIDLHADAESDHVDDCSPLCVCACCSSQSLPTNLLSFDKILIQQKNKCSIGYTESILDISLPIWQPPQLI